MSTYTPDINNLIAIIETNIPDNTSQAITAQKVRTAMESVAYNYDLYALKADMQEYITQSELSEMSYATQSYVMDRIAEIPSVDLSGYVSKDELSAMGYVTETQLQQAAYATESYVNEKISEIPAVDLSAYATKTYVAEYVSTYAPMPDLSSYVTKSELSGMGYVTGEQLQQAAYVNSSDVYSILDNSSYVTSSELSDAGYINTNALDQRLSDAGYITSSALNGYATEAYVASEMQQLQSETYAYVADYVNTYAPMPDLSSYVTKSELDAMAYSQVVEISSADYDLLSYDQKHNGDIYVLTDSYYEYDMSAYATKAYVVDYVNTYAPAPDLSAYATKAYVADYVAAYAPMPDLSSYVTKTELSNAGYVTAAYIDSKGYAKTYTLTQAEYDALIQGGTYDPTTIYIISDAAPADLSYYVTKTELDNMSYATTTYVADYVAAYAPMPDLSAYVTKTELSNAGYITSSALNGYATEAYVADYVNTYAPMPDLSSYVTKTELDNAGYVTAAYIDSKGYAKSYTLTQAEYDALIQGGTYDPTTIYIISDAAPVDLSYYTTYDAISQMGYITATALPVIDENIVPKADNTYTLGDSSYIYSGIYADSFWFNSSSRIRNLSGGIQIVKNGNAIAQFKPTNELSPNSDKGSNLGASDNMWASTYTQNLYLDGTDIKSYIDTYYYPKSYVDTYFVSKAELAACGYLTYSNFQYDSENNTLTIII